jgi:trigger factor
MLKIGFEYEIGLVPDFTLDLEAKTILWNIVSADDKMIDGLERIKNNLVKQFLRKL